MGGLVTDVASWRLIFWGLLAVSALQAVTVITFVPATPSFRDSQALNVIGSALLTLVVMLLVVGATFLGEHSHRIAGGVLLICAAATGGLFVLSDRRSTAPLMPRALLGNRACAGVLRARSSIPPPPAASPP